MSCTPMMPRVPIKFVCFVINLNFLSPEPDDISIVITRIPSPLTDEQLRNLHENIDVNQSSESFGIDIHAFFFISKAFFSPRLGVA